MTLLHYASKAGAAGIGDPDLAAQVVTDLLNKGADVNIRCRWTNMTALHYAAYFDVVPVLKVLLKTTKALGEYSETCLEPLQPQQFIFIVPAIQGSCSKPSSFQVDTVKHIFNPFSLSSVPVLEGHKTTKPQAGCGATYPGSFSFKTISSEKLRFVDLVMTLPLNLCSVIEKHS